MPAGMLAEHQRRTRNTNHFGLDDLVGETVLQHAMLVNTGFMGKGVAPHNGFVWLWKDAGEVREELAGAVDLAGFDVALKAQHGLSNPPGHHDLLQRGIAGALADAVDGALHLSGACRD